jgi:hypothetical protein
MTKVSIICFPEFPHPSLSYPQNRSNPTASQSFSRHGVNPRGKQVIMRAFQSMSEKKNVSKRVECDQSVLPQVPIIFFLEEELGWTFLKNCRDPGSCGRWRPIER